MAARARSRLVANGTLTPEGTPNLETAERLGWKAEWEKAAAEAKARTEAEAKKGGQAVTGRAGMDTFLRRPQHASARGTRVRG